MRNFSISFLLITILCTNLLLGQSPIYSGTDIHHPLVATNGMVSTQHPEATRVGLDILKSGGNAIDAAVAVGFSLAVVLPRGRKFRRWWISNVSR